MKRIADLKTAYIKQIDNETVGKSDWIVYNADHEEIHRLPKELSAKEAMAFIHFGRKFEEIALNNGIQFQKELEPQQLKTYKEMILRFEADRKIMVQENIKLANELDKLTLKYEE